jgi:repressor of nif and glnA expression
MTHRQIVADVLREFGPLSSYGVMHVARAKGYKLSPSSVRTRIKELERDGQVHKAGVEKTPRGHAHQYTLTH